MSGGYFPVTVTLTPHSEALLEAARSRGIGQSDEEIIERALEAVTHAEMKTSAEEKARRDKAVDDMLVFAGKHQLTLGAGGQRLRDLIHEGHRY
jgi:hypothetical protein